MDELASIGLMPEKWGGDVPVVQVSALKGDNVDELLETVMLVAEPFETCRRALWKGYVNIEERAETEPLVLLIEYAVWWGFHSGDVMHTNCSLQVLNIFGCGNCMYGREDRLVTPPKSHQNVAVRSIPFLHVSSKELLKALIGFVDVAGYTLP